MLSEYAPSDWLGGELLEHVRERGLSEAERQAMRAQIADAETEFRISLARKVGPLSPGAPRVDVRVIRGRAGDQRVVWLSHAEIADRMRAMADEIAAANVRLAEVTAATFPTAEDQRAALLYEAGYLSGSLQHWTEHLRAEAERMGSVDDGTRTQPARGAK